MNQKVSNNNNTGFKGVSYQKNANKYSSYINLTGKRYYLGLFDTPEEAFLVRSAAEFDLFGIFAAE